MTVDAQGNIYVAGIAGSADFPRTPPEIAGQSKSGGGMVAKFSPAGKLIWSKVIGALSARAATFTASKWIAPVSSLWPAA